MTTSIITNAYPVASSERTNAAREKMERIITQGRASALSVIEQVQNQIVIDQVVKGSALDFRPHRIAAIPVSADEGRAEREFSGIEIVLPESDYRVVHDNALGQLSERASVPQRYVKDLLTRGDWGAELVAHNFREIYQRGNGTRYLLRSVNNSARGFLSDKYRRLDSRPLLEAFCSSAQALGAIPVEGYALETKVRLRALLPYVFEPLDNEFLVFGVEWGNSDFGNGGHCVRLFNIRLVCTNGMIADEMLRQVHLGARLQDNIEYSQRTYELDTAANAAALKDVVQHALNPARVTDYIGAIRRAAATEINPREAVASLRKQLTKDETEGVIGAFNSPDVVNMPAGNNTYRLAQAMSWFANTEEVKPERKLELQQLAGDMMPKIEAAKPVEV